MATFQKWFSRGVSAFIDPAGRVLAHTGTFQEQALRAKLAWMRGTTAYEVLGDVPWWLAVLLAGTLAFVYRQRDRRTAAVAASPCDGTISGGRVSAAPLEIRSVFAFVN